MASTDAERAEDLPPDGKRDEGEQRADADEEQDQLRVKAILDRDDRRADLRPHG